MNEQQLTLLQELSAGALEVQCDMNVLIAELEEQQQELAAYEKEKAAIVERIALLFKEMSCEENT